MTYAEQLKHPKWQKKRLEVLEASRYGCQNCGEKEKTLHVHHHYYKKGCKVWEYPDDAFECLCEDCHKHRHDQEEELNELLSIAAVHGNSNTETVIGYLKAMVSDIGPCAREVKSEYEGIGASDYFRINAGVVTSEDDYGFNRRDIGELKEFARMVHGGTQGKFRWKGYSARRGN